MGKPKMYGMNKSFVPNARADAIRRKKVFKRGCEGTTPRLSAKRKK